MTPYLTGVAAAVLATTVTACAAEPAHPTDTNSNPEVAALGKAPPLALQVAHAPKALLGPEGGSSSTGSSDEIHDPPTGK